VQRFLPSRTISSPVVSFHLLSFLLTAPFPPLSLLFPYPSPPLLFSPCRSQFKEVTGGGRLMRLDMLLDWKEVKELLEDGIITQKQVTLKTTINS
jgi:hypothetical protein